MKHATVFSISNQSEIDIVLWPKDEVLRKEWAILIKAGHAILKDFRFRGLSYYTIDLDECYFQFVGKNRKKISVDNVEKYGVVWEIMK